MQTEETVLRALGLCTKAGKLIFGVPMICEALKAKKRICLVIEPADNAPNSSKRLHDRCTYYATSLVSLSANGEELARAVGKSARLAAVAVTDEHLAALVRSRIDELKEK